MHKLSNKINNIIDNELIKKPIPMKTLKGIRVGDVDIITEGPLKHIQQSSQIKYRSIFLNITAITLANMLALRQDSKLMDKIYNADQSYGTYYIDSQHLRIRYNQALLHHDNFEIDMFWARYIERRDRVLVAKLVVEQLIKN